MRLLFWPLRGKRKRRVGSNIVGYRKPGDWEWWLTECLGAAGVVLIVESIRGHGGSAAYLGGVALLFLWALQMVDWLPEISSRLDRLAELQAEEDSRHRSETEEEEKNKRKEQEAAAPVTVLSESAVYLLARDLGDTDYKVRGHAARTLGVMGASALDALPALKSCMASENVAEVRGAMENARLLITEDDGY